MNHCRSPVADLDMRDRMDSVHADWTDHRLRGNVSTTARYLPGFVSSGPATSLGGYRFARPPTTQTIVVYAASAEGSRGSALSSPSVRNHGALEKG